MLVSEILARVEADLNDEDNITWPKALLVQYVSDAQRAIVRVRPDAYPTVESISLVDGTRQSLPAGALRLLDVIRNMGADGSTPGKSIREANSKDLDLVDPSWHTRAGKESVRHFMLDERYPTVFFVAPPVDTTANAVQVEVAYATAPAELPDENATVDLSDVYADPIIEWVLYRAYARETDSNASDAESAKHYQTFMNMLGVKSKVDLAFSPGKEATVK